MEGRWTLEGVPGGKWPMVQRGPWLKDRAQVPVVPCDPAAIERAAEALVKIAARWGLGEWQMTGAREMMPEAFRAAGETP